MNTIDICSKLEQVTYLVNAFIGRSPLDPETSVGIGSGVAINEKGDLLTAAHVISGRLPVQAKDINDPNLVILASNKLGEFFEYESIICGVALQNEELKIPLTIDLALLRPKIPRRQVPFVPISNIRVAVGTQVLMAGYPDDMELPFDVDKNLIRTDPKKASFYNFLDLTKQQILMIKSGMVGHKRGFTQTDGVRSLEGEFFYVDNGLHSGASGGPVVNRDGKLI